MLNLLMDVAPLPGERYHRVPRVREVVHDTIDSVVGFGQEATNSAASGGNTTLILGAILAALAALGICLFMVRAMRKRGEQLELVKA